jgi:hypothetical protein
VGDFRRIANENRRRESVHVRRSKEEQGFEDPSKRALFLVRNFFDSLSTKQKPGRREGRAVIASRSPNVLKKNEKGLLNDLQRSFFSGRNLPQRGDAVLPEKS